MPFRKEEKKKKTCIKKKIKKKKRWGPNLFFLFRCFPLTLKPEFQCI